MGKAGNPWILRPLTHLGVSPFRRWGRGPQPITLLNIKLGHYRYTSRTVPNSCYEHQELFFLDGNDPQSHPLRLRGFLHPAGRGFGASSWMAGRLHRSSCFRFFPKGRRRDLSSLYRSHEYLEALPLARRAAHRARSEASQPDQHSTTEPSSGSGRSTA